MRTIIEGSLKTRIRKAAGCVLAALLVAGAGAAAAEEQKLTPVSLRLDIFFYGMQAPILMGIVDGIYRKHGLDVKAAEGRGSGTTLTTVANGSDDFGLADGGTLIRLAAQGMKVKQIVGILERNPMMVFTMPDVKLSEPKDLEGKTGAYTPGSAPEQLFKTFVKRTGIDLQSIKLVSVGDFATRDNLFLTRKVDFDFGFDLIYFPLMQEKCNCTINALRYADYGLNSISTGLVVSDRYANEHPDIVAQFARATVEAIDAAIADPKRAVDAFYEYSKSARSRKQTEQELSLSLKLLHTAATSNLPTGIMAERDWQDAINLLVENESIPANAVTPDMVFTNRFVSR
jgi:NitT/TauT family transport system substrate-binding protein